MSLSNTFYPSQKTFLHFSDEMKPIICTALSSLSLVICVTSISK